MLARVWADVLGVGEVGIQSNFFTLGGDSILSIQVAARALREGVRISPRQVFQHQTVAELALVANTTATVEAEQGLDREEPHRGRDRRVRPAECDVPRPTHGRG